MLVFLIAVLLNLNSACATNQWKFPPEGSVLIQEKLLENGKTERLFWWEGEVLGGQYRPDHIHPFYILLRVDISDKNLPKPEAVWRDFDEDGDISNSTLYWKKEIGKKKKFPDLLRRNN